MQRKNCFHEAVDCRLASDNDLFFSPALSATAALLSAFSVGHAVDKNVHKSAKPRQRWLAGRCLVIDQPTLERRNSQGGTGPEVIYFDSS
jgi:hypothetical protein